MIAKKSHWHEITEEESKLNEIFRETDFLLKRFFELYESVSINTNEEKNISTSSFEQITPFGLELAYILNDITKAVTKITDIWEKWFKEKSLVKYFHELWFEPLYFVRFIREKLNKIAEFSKPRENLKLDFKNFLYWEYHIIIISISSAFDKIANIYLYCNSPRISEEEMNDSKKIKKIRNIHKNLYFENIEKSLEDILSYSVAKQKFLVFNKFVVSSFYWKEIHKSTRNNLMHNPVYKNDFSMEHAPFIVIDFYILLRTLWTVAVVNWNLLEVLDNATSKNNKSPELWKSIRKNIKDSPEELDNHFCALMEIKTGINHNLEN